MAHDVFLNTYSFDIDGSKFIFHSSCKPTPIPTLTPLISLLSCADFEHELSSDSEVFILVAHDISPTTDSTTITQPLLAEFLNVFPADLPTVLPPLHDIQHQIDLVPGAPLPNRSHYRMSPSEHAELWRQVEDLLTRGLVR